MNGRRLMTHPVAAARQATRRRAEGQDDAGFTLIELLVVVVVIPIVVGGISAALLSVFSLQGSVANRVGNSNDSLVASVNFNRDVQSAEQMTTQSTVACGPSSPTPPQTQLLGLRWGANSAAAATGGYQTVVSYVSVPVLNPQTNKTGYNLVRQECTSGTTTPDSSFNVAHNIGTPTVTIRGANNADVTASFASWTSAQGVTGVTFKVQAPDSSSSQTEYSYSLVGLPGQSTSQSSASVLSNPTGPGCGFAAAGSGTYANQLCFADFTGFNGTQHSSGNCQTLTRPIANTPYSLRFCVSVSGTNVTPAAIPTYYDPSGDHSEAFLGNNGFYTGIPGDPALYQTGNGVSTVYLTNVQVLDAAGHPATGWTLVTGDSESTDANEWMAFQSNLNWSVLPNNGASNLWGNACYNTAQPGNNGALAYSGPYPASDSSVTTPANIAPLSVNTTTFATGVSSIVCGSSTQLNKTGTMMLQAQEPTGSSAAQTLTVSMRGAGLQAMFFGVLL
jgi:prepilin-type N-terminal cleavage/methylation domain-containing protein